MALKLDHIVIYVAEMAVSLPFYEALFELLGLERTGDSVFHDGDGLYFDFRQASEPSRGYHRFGPGLNHLGFTAPSCAIVDQVRDEMAARGFEVPDIQLLEGGYCLFMRDPDGMRVEVTAYGG